MDINNYSYAPTLCIDNDIRFFDNDDIVVYVNKERNYNHYIYWLTAYSYDGSLDVSECFKNESAAVSVFDYIKNMYADTIPNDNTELQEVVNKYSESTLNVIYDFETYVDFHNSFFNTEV